MRLFSPLPFRLITNRKVTSERRSNYRPHLETLEDRLAPASFIVTSTADSGAGTLRAAVDAANAAGGTNTITTAASVAGQTVTLTSNDTTNPFAFGPTGLVIAAGDDLTITGGDASLGLTISGGNTHRVFGVLTGGTLTVQYVTITGGLAQGGTGGNGNGAGGGGGAGLGGAIFNAGTLNVIESTITGNQAIGGAGGNGLLVAGGGGGGGGGGVDVVTVTGVMTTLSSGLCDPGTAIMTVAVKLPVVVYVCESLISN